MIGSFDRPGAEFLTGNGSNEVNYSYLINDSEYSTEYSL